MAENRIGEEEENLPYRNMQTVVIAEFEERPQPTADQLTAEKIQIAANGALRSEQLIFGACLQP